MPHLAPWLPSTPFWAELHVHFSQSRLASLLSVAVGVSALIVAGFLYVRQLNKSHARRLLAGALENELTERGKAEENLRKSEGFYHSLVESLPQSILRKDLEGRFTFVNQKFRAALERPMETIVGSTDFGLLPLAAWPRSTGPTTAR